MTQTQLTTETDEQITPEEAQELLDAMAAAVNDVPSYIEMTTYIQWCQNAVEEVQS